MNHRQLGKDGADIPVIGLGAWPIGGGMGNMDDRDCIDTVRTAIDSGITLLDTAQAYRTSEATLGRALKDGYRERCFLATKVSRQYSRGDIENAIENSLRNLDVDYVDLYQIHSWNPQYPIEESMETMARLQEQGKTRFIGVSNFNAAQMQQAYDIAPFHSNQPRYNMFDRNIEAEDSGFLQTNGYWHSRAQSPGERFAHGKIHARPRLFRRRRAREFTSLSRRFICPLSRSGK